MYIYIIIDRERGLYIYIYVSSKAPLGVRVCRAPRMRARSLCMRSLWALIIVIILIYCNVIIIVNHYYHYYSIRSGAVVRMTLGGAASRARLWAFIKGGCSRRGVQWMGVVLYNQTAYHIK